MCSGSTRHFPDDSDNVTVKLSPKSGWSAPADVQHLSIKELHKMVYPKVSGLAAWSENCKRYSSLPLSAVVSLFCESV
jgi:hypothetical protein